MSRQIGTRACIVVFVVLLGTGLTACGSSSSTSTGDPVATVGPAPSGPIVAAGDVTVFDSVSSQTRPYGDESLEKRQKMAAQICDAIASKTNGDALAWIQRVEKETDLSPLEATDYPNLLLFASAAIRYKCPGYLDQIKQSQATLTIPQG